MTKPFVKSADTSSPIANSRAALAKMLERYGATHFSVAEDWERGRVTINFVAPDSLTKGAARVPVQLPVDIRRIYDALYGQPTKWASGGRVPDPAPYSRDKKGMEQAARVAWRNLVLWVDAALSAAVANLQTITEAFFAHTLVQTDGGMRRMVQVIDDEQARLPAGVRALLAAPAETTAT